SQDGNDNYNAADSVSRPFSIGKADQKIDFGPLADKTYGDADFDVSATASSGLAVSFTASGHCAFVGPQVDITGAGDCTITASQGGNENFKPADDVTHPFTIAKASQTIDFGPLAGKTFGDVDFTIAATASSGLPVSFTAAGGCMVSGTTVHIAAVNACTITASQGGNGNYNPAPNVSRTFNVGWPFTGFYSPIDNLPTMNIANAGSAIPVK